jgi:hypothetical protein
VLVRHVQDRIVDRYEEFREVVGLGGVWVGPEGVRGRLLETAGLREMLRDICADMQAPTAST